MQLNRKCSSVRRRERGLTLVEVLIATGIVGIVAGFAWLAIAGRMRGSAKRTVVQSELRQIVVALNLYRNDNDDGFPSNWRSIGYVGVNRRDKFGAGFPPKDVYYDNPPRYDVSYHTPECAAPPHASPTLWLFRQFISQFKAEPRVNTLDVDLVPAVHFTPACKPNSKGKHAFSYLRNGQVRTIQLNHVKSMSVNLAGTLSYQWWPDWVTETTLGG